MNISELKRILAERGEMIHQCQKSIDQMNRQQMATNAYLRDELAVQNNWKNVIVNFFAEIRVGIEDLDALITALGTSGADDWIDVRDRICTEIGELCQRWEEIIKQEEAAARRYSEAIDAALRAHEDPGQGVSP